MSLIKAAVVQAAPVLFDTPKTLSKLAELARDAAGKGAELVGFPRRLSAVIRRGSISGQGLGRGARRGERTSGAISRALSTFPGRRQCALVRSRAITAFTSSLASSMRNGGTLYCTALTHAPSGKLISKHRKLMPTALERLVWGFGDGSTIGVVETALGRIGSVICWENYMPRPSMPRY